MQNSTYTKKRFSSHDQHAINAANNRETEYKDAKPLRPKAGLSEKITSK
jgi:hypothetical protein